MVRRGFIRIWFLFVVLCLCNSHGECMLNGPLEMRPGTFTETPSQLPRRTNERDVRELSEIGKLVEGNEVIEKVIFLCRQKNFCIHSVYVLSQHSSKWLSEFGSFLQKKGEEAEDDAVCSFLLEHLVNHLTDIYTDIYKDICQEEEYLCLVRKLSAVNIVGFFDRMSCHSSKIIVNSFLRIEEREKFIFEQVINLILKNGETTIECYKALVMSAANLIENVDDGDTVFKSTIENKSDLLGKIIC
jgi:hypothetical protein